MPSTMNNWNATPTGWSTAGGAEATIDAPELDSSWEIGLDSAGSADVGGAAFARLRAAIELAHIAAAQKEEAIEAIKTLVANGTIRPVSDEKTNTFSASGVRVNRTPNKRWEQSTKAKEKLAELTGDLRTAGEIKEIAGEDKWSARLV